MLQWAFRNQRSFHKAPCSRRCLLGDIDPCRSCVLGSNWFAAFARWSAVAALLKFWAAPAKAWRSTLYSSDLNRFFILPLDFQDNPLKNVAASLVIGWQ